MRLRKLNCIRKKIYEGVKCQTEAIQMYEKIVLKAGGYKMTDVFPAPRNVTLKYPKISDGST